MTASRRSPALAGLLAAAVAVGSSLAPAVDLRVPSDDYPTIDSALAAASDGDAILLAPGDYELAASLTVSGLQLAIRGDGGVATVRSAAEGGGLAIQDGADVAMELLRLELALAVEQSAVAMENVVAADGTTAIESSVTATGCQFRSSAGAGLRAVSAERIELIRCVAVGAAGSNGDIGVVAGAGHPGLDFVDCPDVAMAGGSATGGVGGLGGSSFFAGGPGGDGGPGARLAGESRMAAEGGLLQGGQGGQGGSPFSGEGQSGDPGAQGAAYVVDATSVVEIPLRRTGLAIR